jgi:hypothetical protein
VCSPTIFFMFMIVYFFLSKLYHVLLDHGAFHSLETKKNKFTMFEIIYHDITYIFKFLDGIQIKNVFITAD